VTTSRFVFSVATLVAASLAIAPLVVSAGPSLSSPSRSSDAGTFRVTPFVAPLPSPPDVKIERIPPDPPPMREQGQWIFDLRYDKGDVYLVTLSKIDLAAPQETPRAMGRFAIELFEGPTLIERVRFDFPLLGVAETIDAGYKSPPSFERKLVSRIGVVFPASDRGTKLELLDRATNKRWKLPWPPEDANLDAGPPIFRDH
jgi:hypothetical protein